jgi:arginase
MNAAAYDIEIISAPSILGLKPTGVEELGESLLASGLAENLRSGYPVIHVPTLNTLYSEKRDPETNCLNPVPLRDFSLELGKTVIETIDKKRFPLVLGGDCSILLGIISGLRSKGTYGLVFLDAHADFYEPERSITGEAADMDLALITGRGPDILTNINHLRPYVKDENVVHIGQRDWEETKKYGSQDIRETNIKCIDLTFIKKLGLDSVTAEILQYTAKLDVHGFWIHFDTDVLSDEINPAVDYRLPGGLYPDQIQHLIRSLLLNEKMIGMSVTIFNPRLDEDGSISKVITKTIANSLQ